MDLFVSSFAFQLWMLPFIGSLCLLHPVHAAWVAFNVPSISMDKQFKTTELG